MPKTTISLGSNGQYKTTVPKGIAEAMNLENAKIEWTVESADRVSMKVVERE